MKRLFLLLTFIPFFSACRFSSKDLPGKGTEGLWGDRIRLNREIRSDKPTLIVPFSTSNCGYCMIDGYFTERNYIRNNIDFGGSAYHMCLFNPQLDIYAFQKHFGWDVPVLTYPPGLHRYHENGFPTVLAFRNGEQLIREFYNYAECDSLNRLLWEGSEALHPTGNLHMATRLIYENGNFGAVCVVSDTQDITADERAFAEKWKGYTFSSLATISPEEKTKHLFIRSGPDLTRLAGLFQGQEIPLSFDGNRFILGGYRFDPDTVAFYGCFPNPFNRQKYIVLSIVNDRARLFAPVNYLDYVVFTGSRPSTAKKLLYGHFAKDEEDLWRFSGETSFSDVPVETLCIGKCPLGAISHNPSKADPRQQPSLTSNTSDNSTTFTVRTTSTTFTLGGHHCRFPEVCPDTGGSCWVAWEEGGDILLGRISPTGEAESWYAERSAGDSYNPKVIVQDGKVWICYLNNRDGYYRIYAKSFEGNRFSGEIPVTPRVPYDVITPEVAVTPTGGIVVVWCDWLANQRLLKYREIRNGIPEEITDIKVALPVYISDYTNAWWPSVVAFRHAMWGAWNQHYPATCGVYGGPLSDTAGTITQSSEAMDDREQGGYPDIFTDGNDLFVVWEGSGWDVYYQDATQPIKIAVYDGKSGHWSPGRVLTEEGRTSLNQTPCGACDSKGNTYVVWSGRSHLKEQPWGIYMAKETAGKWSDPVLLSRPDEPARHPKIVIGPDDRLWVSWQSGTGQDMRVRIFME